MWRIKLQKIVRNLLHKLRKLYMNGTVIWKFFWSPQVIENSSQYLLPLEQIFYRKQSLSAPDPPLALLTGMFFRVWKEGPHTALPLLSTTIPRDSRIPNFCHLYPENRFLSWYRIPCQDFGESCFPSSGQIPYILRFSESRTTVVRSIPGSRQCLSRPWFCVWLVDSTYIHTRDLFDHDSDGATTRGYDKVETCMRGHCSAIDHAIIFYDPNKWPSSLGIPSDPVNINKIKCFSRVFGCEKQANGVLFEDLHE